MANKRSDLPATLLDAVDQALRSGSVSALSLRDVAKRAGVSHAAPAHHFGSKSGLLTAFAAQGYRKLAEAVLAEVAASGPTDSPGVLAAVGRGYVRFALEEPARFEAMFRIDALNEDDPELLAATESAFSLLGQTIERCRSDGYLGELDPQVVAVAAWSIVHGLASLWISGRLSGRIAERSAESLAAEVSELFVDAVLRRR